jgi:methionyl aminopeptidase
MSGVTRKSAAEIALMRRAGAVVADVLALVEELAVPGASSAEIADAAEQQILAAGAGSNFKGYHGFPSVICLSIDSEVVHGIPGDREIKAGALVSVDAGAIIEGWHGDAARSFYVGGEAPAEVARLIRVTREALDAGIAAARPGGTIEEISAAIEDVGLAAGVGIVRPYVGHGIGRAMHEAPQVPNYRTGRKSLTLAPGHCLAIEPMFTLGSPEVGVLDDEWTVVTIDGSLAAHFEDSIAITPEGAQILTRP